MTEAYGPFRSLQQTQHLGTSRLQTIRAGVWEKLVSATLDLFAEAAKLINANAPGYDYKKRPEWWGSGKQKVLGQGVSLPGEDTITDALTRASNSLIKTLPKNHPAKKMRIYVVDQRPRHGDTLGAQSHPTDIQIAATGGLDYLDLRIEAKRLLSGTDLAHYIGPKGLKRFSDPIPYTIEPIGMMLGYTFRYDDSYWHKAIGERCEKDYNIVPYETVMAAQNPFRICIFPRNPIDNVAVGHFLLSFESNPSARQIDLDQATTKIAAAAKKKIGKRGS